jgi:hypothetical protein
MDTSWPRTAGRSRIGHIRHLLPMYQLRDSAPLTVTFDTNTLDAVVSPDTAQRGTGSCGTIVQDAIRAGRIRGFFSETVFTLEGITNADRPEVLGKTGIAFQSSSSGPNQITSEIAVRHFRKPLDPRASDRIQKALTLGMQPLRTAADLAAIARRTRITRLTSRTEEYPNSCAAWRRSTHSPRKS